MDIIGILLSVSITISGLVSLFTGNVVLWKSDNPVKSKLVGRLIGLLWTIGGLFFLASDIELELGYPLRKFAGNSLPDNIFADILTDFSYFLTDVVEENYIILALFAGLIAFLVTLIAPKHKTNESNPTIEPTAEEVQSLEEKYSTNNQNPENQD